jgi:NAD(P)H-hydrate repair Nnr-like enzyme with NAD(P)H-hydrate dehydratase domain
MTAASAAVFLHGLAADRWPATQTLTASALAAKLQS